MQHPVIGHDEAKSAVTFREMRILRVPSSRFGGWGYGGVWIWRISWSAGGGAQTNARLAAEGHCRQLARSEPYVGLTKTCYMRRYMAGVMGGNEAADFG